MLNKNIDQINEQDLQNLINDSVTEWKTFDYKAILPGNSDKDKREFLADVSSFANATGGDIIFGIECDNSTGIPKSLDGISATNFDQEILRLESSIRDGIEPRINAIELKRVPLSSSKSSLIVRIPKSWNSPHRVTYKGHDKFYGRSTNGKYPLDVHELRNLFNLSSALAEKIRDFRIDRVMKVLAEETPAPLLNNAKILLHVLPVISFNPSQAFDLTALQRQPHKLPTVCSGVLRIRYNLDGMITYGGERNGKYEAYTQFFRNGIVETVDASMLEQHSDKPFIPSVAFEKDLIAALSQYVLVLKELSVALPAYVFVSLLGVGGYVMATGGPWPYTNPMIDRDNLLIPESVIESYDVQAEHVLRACFDSVWNACGFPQSPNYDANGQWRIAT
jgi:hypothetical protein